jgi:uracil-DNA glycosylase
MSEEYSSLVSELREQVLYLQELGVENLDAEFQISDSKFQISNSKFQIPNSESSILKSAVAEPPKAEFYVPESPIVANVPKIEPRILPVPTNQSRQSLLSSSRLSNRTPSKNQPTTNYIQSNQQVTEMPKKSNEPTLAQTLFGDMSQSLLESKETVAEIQAEIGNCQRCDLCKERTNIAHSTGNLQADLMFVGEAPGADEDAQGKPFVGRAGQLLTKIIEAIGISREDVFIGNINRCRPPQNRQPTPIESETCKPYLIREIAVVRPKVIIVLGNTACQNLLETKVGISKLRGNFQDYYGVKVMPTFHPAYLLRDPHKKREVWEDMKKVRDYLSSLS